MIEILNLEIKINDYLKQVENITYSMLDYFIGYNTNLDSDDVINLINDIQDITTMLDKTINLMEEIYNSKLLESKK